MHIPIRDVLALVKDDSEDVLDFTSSASSLTFFVSLYDSPRPMSAASYFRSADSVVPGFCERMSL